MAGLKFDITGDNGNMLSALQGVQNGVRQTQRVVEQSGQGIEQAFSKVQSAAAAAAGAFSAKELVRNVLEVRGQFQQLEVAFTTMLGSADKANDLMSQLVRTAATTPFDLKSVSEGAKQLLAYGTQADEVNGTLIRLGDIAAGLSIPLNDLVYLYGTTMTQGRMFTQDLRQFQGRGIPIADELAKIFGVTKDKVGELVTAGKVGAAEVQQAIENMTNAGSRFGGLMEAQSHTITGQISNIEDAIDSMFNDIGKANEGVINDALGGVSYLVEHWKEIGQIVLNVAAAYGIAKAAVVAWSTYQKIHNLLMEKAAVQMALAKAEGIAMSEAEAMASVATMGFKNALNALKVAIASNPVGALAVVLTTVFTAMQLLDDETTELATASNKYGESAAKSIQKVKTLSDEVKGLSNSNKTVTTSTKFSKDVLEELNQVLDESGVARIKEGDSIDTVNKKREMAISLIKEEAIERQRLNNIDAGNKEFDDKINSANEQLRKDLANATFNSTGESILNKIFGSADEVREKASAIFTVISQTVQENADLVANKTGSAYDKGLNEIYGKIRAKMEAMGVSKAALDKTWTDGGWLKQDNLVQKYIDSIQGATEAHYDYNKSINAVAEAEKRAADKTLTFSDKVAGISRALQGPNDGVHQLYKNIQKLMEKYKKNTIGFEIQFSGKVPAWMDKMGIPQLSSLAKRFTSLGESLKKGQTMNVNGKTFTKEQLLQRGADYASAMKAKQDKEDSAKNNENKGKSNPIAEQKKALQEKLNALSYQEAAGRKGAELRRKINALAKKEKVYSSSYDTDNAKEAERKAKEAERKAKEAADKAKRKAEEAARKREYVFESNVTRKNKEEEDAIKAAEAKEEERIASITDAGEKERAAYQLQYDKTIRQVRKEADDLRKAKYDENKRDWDNKNTDKTKVYSDTEEGKKSYKEIKLTTDQESYLQSLISKADKEYTAQRKKWQQEEVDALNSYLKEYGSFEEKKLAITKEYEEKMQNAKSVGEKATLQMQRDKEIEKAKEDNINTSIDWNGIFSDLQGHTKDYLLGLRDQLQDLLSSGNLPIDQMQVVSEKINAIDEELGKQQGIWNFIGEKTREHNRRLKEAADAQERLNVARNQEATEALRLNEVKQEAQKQLSSAGINMSLDEISTSSLNGKIDLTDEKFKSMSPILQKLAVAEAKLAEARKNTITATNKAKQAEDGAKEKPAQKIANWFYGKQEFIEDKGIDQLPDLLGSIGLGKAGDKVSKGLDAFNSAAGAAGDFASGNYIGAALKGISAIKSFGSMLGIGGGNEKEVARTTERLTKSNEELGKRIDSLSERIGNSAGNKAVNAYETALKAQKEINANSMEILKKQMGYHSAHHSNNSYASDSKIASYNEDAQRAFAAAGVDSANITGLSSIYSLSPEQLKAIRDFAPNLWKYLTEVGKYDKKEYWDAVVEQAGKTEKLTEQIKNNLTQTSFDSLRSSFLDTLMDMNADAEDWSNNFAKMLFKSLVNRSVLNDDFDKWLKDFQNKWAKKLSDGNMSQSDYEAYKSEYSKKMEELKKKTDNLASYMGYSDENAAQKATANGVPSITFEQATNIIALTTAGNISRDQTKELVTSIVSNIASLSSFSSSTSATIVEIRNLMITNNSYLEDILKNSKNIYNDFSSKIDNINRNLKELK
nr:MAG TPA: tail tape measure protein [Caudoviricetes sp.]